MLTIDVEGCDVTVCLASWPPGETLPAFQRVQVDDAVAERFREIATTAVGRLHKSYEAGDLVAVPYNAIVKPDSHEVEHIHVSDHSGIGKQIGMLKQTRSMPPFREDDEFLDHLRFYVIVLRESDGQTAYFFRSYSPKMELTRSRRFGLTFGRGQYNEFTKPLFLFDFNIDCIIVGGDIFILNKGRFQHIFRFFEQVFAVAHKTLDQIESAIPIDNFDELREACEGHLQMLQKLKNIAEQPYLSRVTMADMKKVIREASLPIRTAGRGASEKLVFDPKNKWLILKLLDDDYLRSLMTDEWYEANSKRRRV